MRVAGFLYHHPFGISIVSIFIFIFLFAARMAVNLNKDMIVSVMLYIRI